MGPPRESIILISLPPATPATSATPQLVPWRTVVDPGGVRLELRVVTTARWEEHKKTPAWSFVVRRYLTVREKLLC